MSKSQTNVQDVFLNQLRKENTTVTIYLTTGVQLRGIIRDFDLYTVLLESPGRPTQIVYKHAMTSIVPMRPVQEASGHPNRHDRTSESLPSIRPGDSDDQAPSR